MLVKLMYQDAECIMDGEMHVNPEHNWIHGDHDGMDELRAAWNRRAQ